MTNRVALKAKSSLNAKIRRCVKFAAFLTSGNGVRGMIKILNNILTVPLDNDESDLREREIQANAVMQREAVTRGNCTSHALQVWFRKSRAKL